MATKSELEKSILVELKFLEDNNILPDFPEEFIINSVNLTPGQRRQINNILGALLEEMWDVGVLSEEQKYDAMKEVLDRNFNALLTGEAQLLRNRIYNLLGGFNWNTISKTRFFDFVDGDISAALFGAGISQIPTYLRVATIDQLQQLDAALETLEQQQQEQQHQEQQHQEQQHQEQQQNLGQE